MSRIRPPVDSAGPKLSHEDAVLLFLEKVAWLMDRAVAVPGTKYRVGLDAFLGLLPVGGDVFTGFIQAALVLVALRHYHVPKTVAARMAGNVLLDIGIGAIPFAGDLFDVVFKANTRNLRLLEPYRTIDAHAEVLGSGHPRGSLGAPAAPRRRGTSWKLIVPIAVVLLGAVGLSLLGFVTLVRWLIS
ncbi:DUF4112 domain-containing protein [Isosphaeraceae bacterium EP7]